MPLVKTRALIRMKGLQTQYDQFNAPLGALMPHPAGALATDQMNMWARLRTDGQGFELRKRFGNVQAVGANTQARRLMTFKGRKFLITDRRMVEVGANGNIQNVTGDPNGLESANIGGAMIYNEQIRFRAGDFNSSNAKNFDCAVGGGYTCIVSEAGLAGGQEFINIDLIENATGRHVLLNPNAGAGSWSFVRKAKVLALQTGFLLIGIAAGGTNLVGGAVDYSTLTFGGGATLVANDVNATANFDMILETGTPTSFDAALLAYHSVANTLKFMEVTISTGALPWTAVPSVSPAPVTVAVNPNQCLSWLEHNGTLNDQQYLAYVDSTGGQGARVRQFNVNAFSDGGNILTADATLVAARQIAGYRSGVTNEFLIYYEVSAATSFNTNLRIYPGVGAVTLLPIGLRSMGLASRAFRRGGGVVADYYVLATYSSPLQNCFYLLKGPRSSAFSNVSGVFYTGHSQVFGKALYSVAHGLNATASFVTSVPALDSLRNICAAGRFINTDSTGVRIFGAVALTVDFAPVPGRFPVLGDNIHIPGGVPKAYDGSQGFSPIHQSILEIGFHHFPEKPTLLGQTAGGGLTLLGTYSYKAVWVRIDASGTEHTSAESETATVTLTGTQNRIVVDVPSYRIGAVGTEMQSPFDYRNRIEVRLFRTLNGGTTFFRTVTGSGSSAYPYNFAAFDTSQIIDDTSDAVLGTKQLLYTTGGVLPHSVVPSCTLMESWRNRLFLAGIGDNPLELWPSNEYVSGEGVSFSDALVITMEAEGGRITALAEMDDRLIIFKSTSIYIMGGAGPARNGDGNYDQPVRLTTSVGALSQSSVVKMRDGVMFRSTNGIYTLTKGMQLVRHSAMDGFDALTITAGVVLEDNAATAGNRQAHVRFSTAEGPTLVYHYELLGEDGLGIWTTFGNQPANDAIVWGNRWAYLRTDNTVREEVVGTFNDIGAGYVCAAMLAFMPLAGMLGRFRFYGLQALIQCSQVTSRTVFTRFYYDYEFNTGSETQFRFMSSTDSRPPHYMVQPARERISALAVLIATNADTTDGMVITGFAIEVGVRPSAAAKLQQAQYLGT